jgi:hypothetical protein
LDEEAEQLAACLYAEHGKASIRLARLILYDADNGSLYDYARVLGELLDLQAATVWKAMIQAAETLLDPTEFPTDQEPC